jgi:cytochrome c-type biogenesis protein
MGPEAFIALYGAGVASFFAPCVLPLVPAYLGVIGGEGAKRSAVVRSTLLFVLGFSVTFAALGASVGALASQVTSFARTIEIVGGVAVIGFGALLLGIAVPGRGREWRPLTSRAVAMTGTGRPVVIGVAFGAAWSPCVGPILGAALTAAATGGSASIGAARLATYAIGLGTPFLIASLGVSVIPGGRWMVVLERLSGVTLVILGVILVSGRYVELMGLLGLTTGGAR